MARPFMAPYYTADVGRAEEHRPVRVITKSFKYAIGSEKSTELVIIPAGFCTDGASVPMIFNSIIEPWGKYAQAAIIHDFLYATGSLPKADADNIFREAIDRLGSDLETDASTFRGQTSAWFGWIGVKLFGKSAYDNGMENYRKRANPVLDRANERDHELAKIIITDPEKLFS